MKFSYSQRKMDKLLANSEDPDQTHILLYLIWVCTVYQLPF